MSRTTSSRSSSRGRVSTQLFPEAPAVPSSPKGGSKSRAAPKGGRSSTNSNNSSHSQLPQSSSSASLGSLLATQGGNSSMQSLNTSNGQTFVQMDAITRCSLVLEPFLRKLKSCQPTFEDEDVAAPKLVTLAGTRSPSRRMDDDGVDLDPEVWSQNEGLLLGGAGMSRMGSPTTPLLSLMKSPEPEKEDQAVKALHEAVDQVDPMQLQVPKKTAPALAAMDAVKAAYQYLMTVEQQGRKRRAGMATTTSRSAVASKVNSPNTTLSQSTEKPQVIISTVADEQLEQTKVHSWMVLAQIVECLIVYGNKNDALLQELMSKSENLIIALRVMERAHYLASDSPFEACKIATHRAAREIDHLEGTLLTNDVPELLTGKLVMVYAQEFLMDAAVPPAVCSGRYEAANDHAFKQKGLLCTALLQTKCGPFLQQLVDNRSFQHIASLCAFALCAKYKTRQKFCERLATEHNLFERMANDVFGVPTGSPSTPRRHSSTNSAFSAAQRKKQARLAKQQQLKQKKLMAEENTLTRCLDILTAFATPPEDDDLSPATIEAAKKRKPVAWSTHEDLPSVLEGCFNLLVDIPADAEQRGQMGLYIVKITTFLEYVLELNSPVILEKMIELINGTLDQVFCTAPSRLLPLIAKVVEAPLLLKGTREDWTATVATWYGSLTIHAGYSQSAKKYRNRANCRKVEPFFRFATNLCVPREPHPFLEGSKEFLEKTLVTAVVIVDMYKPRGNLLYSVALHTVKALRRVNIQPSPKMYPSPAYLTSAHGSSNPLLLEAETTILASPRAQRGFSDAARGRTSSAAGAKDSSSPRESSRGKRGRSPTTGKSSDKKRGASPSTLTLTPLPLGDDESLFMRDEQTPVPETPATAHGSTAKSSQDDGNESVSPTIGTNAMKATWNLLQSLNFLKK